MEKKFRELEKVIFKYQISDDEVATWLSERAKNKNCLISTKLPLVYRCGNEFCIKNGLDLSHRDELWGVMLFSRTMLALACGAGKDVASTSWKNVKEFAEKMRFNGKSGSLPSKEVLAKYCGYWENKKFSETLKVLNENNIKAQEYSGCLWCSEEREPSYSSYCFDLLYYALNYRQQSDVANTRIAIAF